jgi:hypothetical protein
MTVDVVPIGKVISTPKRPSTPEVFYFWLPNLRPAVRAQSLVKATAPFGKHEVFGWVDEIKEYATAESFAADNLEGPVDASAYAGELPIRICRAVVVVSDPPGSPVKPHYRVMRPTTEEWDRLWVQHAERLRELAGTAGPT